MQRTDKMVIVIGVSIIAVLLMGQVLLAATPYYRNISSELNGDTVTYDIDTNIYSDYAAVTLTSEIDYGLENYIICYDDTHLWFTGYGLIQESIEHLTRFMEINGLTVYIMTSKEVAALMSSNISENSFKTGVIFVTGSLPAEIYGNDSSLLIDWLSAGGVIYWGGGPIGKYVSYSVDDELEIMQDYDLLLFGEEDVVRDSNSKKFNRNLEGNELANIMYMLFNECTYGIDNSSLENSLDFGFAYEQFKSVTLTKFHDGAGMIVVFGGSINADTSLYVMQVIASGMDYSSSVTDYEKGTGKSASGVLSINEYGINRLFVYVGSIQGIVSKTFVL